jgi:hypothetical protein
MLKKNIQELIAEIRRQYDRVREKQEFLRLKQSELRPGDEMSFFGYWEAKQNLAMEQSLLSGHAFMVQQELQKRRITLDARTARILREIANTSRIRYV